MNYDIHDKEMVAIVLAFQEWEVQLKSCQLQVIVWTDHKNLEYFTTSKVLSRRQARWSERLSESNFVVKYRPGDKNGKPDALSRRWDLRPEAGSEDLQPIQALFKPVQLQISAAKVARLRDTFRESLLRSANRDRNWVATRDVVMTKKPGLDPHFSIEDELLMWKGNDIF